MSVSNQPDKERYLRFPLSRRIEHWVTAISFIILAVTGLPQKYQSAFLSENLIAWMGGVDTVRRIHRVAAVVLALAALYHLGTLIYHWYVRRGRLSMLLSKDDAVNAWQSLRYNLGLEGERPKQGFYTFEEKAEYWALIWGTVIMIITGFFLWNPITAARYLPGELIPAAKAAHGGEALLAALAIVLWHLYHVLVRHFNKSMFTGYLSAEEMHEEHPLALHQPPPPKPAPDVMRRRRSRFLIGYGVLATLWLVGWVWFVTSEQTASANPSEIPDIQRIEPFSPLTPTPLPTAELADIERLQRIGTTWDDGLGALLANRCGDCHNPRTGEANLDLTTYQGALQGGDSGPAVVPNSPGSSLALIFPRRAEHPQPLAASELDALRLWIQNGAPER